MTKARLSFPFCKFKILNTTNDRIRNKVFWRTLNPAEQIMMILFCLSDDVKLGPNVL